MAKLGSHAGRKRTAAVDTPMILRIREIIGARGIAGPVVGRGGLGIDKGGRLFGMDRWWVGWAFYIGMYAVPYGLWGLVELLMAVL